MTSINRLTLPFRILFAIIMAYLADLFPARATFLRADPCAGNDNTPGHYVNKYDDDVKLSMQQSTARLEGAVTLETGIVGASQSVDTATATEVGQVTNRNADIQYANTPKGRRWIDLSDYDWADYIDSFDQLRVLENPNNKYVRLAVSAHNRQKDRCIINASLGNARQTDVAGASSLVALPSGQKIVNGGTGLTMAKLRSGLELLNKAEAGSPEEGGIRTFALSAKGLSDLMSDSTVTSRDYSELQALRDYKINYFMGMTWVRTESLPKSGGVRSGMIICKDCVHLGIGAEITNDISQRKDKRGLPWQVYSKASLGGVRREDIGVVQIDYTES